MENLIKLIIVDDNPEVTDSIHNYLKQKNNIEVTGTARDAFEAIRLIEEHSPDAVVLDLILPNADGFYLLEYLKSKPHLKHPKIIVLSCLSHESLISRASALGADYYIIKPFSMDVLYKRLTEICNLKYTISGRTSANSMLETSCQQQINEIFSAIGMPINTKGRKYLVECVLASLESPDLTDNLSRNLYPKISLDNGTNAYNIERSIRHTIELAWNNYKFKESVPYFNKNIKPSNKQIIKLMQQILSLTR